MSYSASASIVINASRQSVWEAVTRPELVKQYFFGTNLVTNWQVGSPILFRGEWEGKSYEDKGTVLDFEPLESLSYSYWSSMGGTEDKPENYQRLRYQLEELDGKTKLTITQENAATQESADHSAGNWQMVLEGLKKVVEESSQSAVS